MKLKAKLLIALVAACFLQGCFITNTPGFYSGYKRLNETEKNKVRFLSIGSKVPIIEGEFVYAICAQSLLNTIEENDTTLVYIWGPQCHSNVCASLRSVQSLCDKRKYSLYVVAEYYDMEQIGVQPRLKNPLLAINQKYYKTDYCPKYTQMFTSELLQGFHLSDELKYSRYLLFKGNRFVKAVNTFGDDVEPAFPYVTNRLKP